MEKRKGRIYKGVCKDGKTSPPLSETSADIMLYLQDRGYRRLCVYSSIP